ncbi:hypothetical protein D3C86_1849920 [compost metagenome]
MQKICVHLGHKVLRLLPGNGDELHLGDSDGFLQSFQSLRCESCGDPFAVGWLDTHAGSGDEYVPGGDAGGVFVEVLERLGVLLSQFLQAVLRLGLHVDRDGRIREDLEQLLVLGFQLLGL